MLTLPFIMETSLAPSPIANVTAFLFFLINSTTSAFCKGVTRQQITDLHCDETSRNNFSNCGCKQCTNECPFTTSAKPPGRLELSKLLKRRLASRTLSVL